MQTVLRDQGSGTLMEFVEPVALFSTDQIDLVSDLLARADEFRRQGFWVAGYVAYEAAGAFDDALVTHPAQPGEPLCWFGAFRRRSPAVSPVAPGWFPSAPWQDEFDRVAYCASIHRIQDAIASGATYQVNFSFRRKAPMAGSPQGLFWSIAQDAPFAALFDLGSRAIVSASPELFFSRTDDRVTCRPMKGTAPRGATPEEDRASAEGLRQSEKNRAENLMIVDMIRNDLSRVADPESLQVTALHQLEPYPTLWQMTSTVEAQTDVSFPDLFAALFPCASITGAPKAETMRLIRDLERSLRGIYCGAIGYLSPEGDEHFSVAIRTATIDRKTSLLTYGVGSGVVWDSDAGAEYDECLLKAKVVEPSLDGVALLETMRFEPGEGIVLLEEHLQRLKKSARFFSYPYRLRTIRQALDAALSLANGVMRVRLLLHTDGSVEVETAELVEEGEGPLRVTLADAPIDADNPFLQHKTTRREIYRHHLDAHPDCAEVILYNQRGELTEGCWNNLIVRLDGVDYTPPVEAGLLPGTMRQKMLQDGELLERVLTAADLQRAEAIWLINSVRGRRPATAAWDQ